MTKREHPHDLRIDYQESDVMLDLWGGTSGTFNGIDRFNRITDQRGVNHNGGTTDLDRSKYGYDRTSNTVNEITAISESTGPSWVDPA